MLIMNNEQKTYKTSLSEERKNELIEKALNTPMGCANVANRIYGGKLQEQTENLIRPLENIPLDWLEAVSNWIKCIQSRRSSEIHNAICILESVDHEINERKVKVETNHVWRIVRAMSTPARADIVLRQAEQDKYILAVKVHPKFCYEDIESLENIDKTVEADLIGWLSQFPALLRGRLISDEFVGIIFAEQFNLNLLGISRREITFQKEMHGVLNLELVGNNSEVIIERAVKL